MGVAAETLVENLSRGRRYETIHGALCEPQGGDQIVVHPRFQKENIRFEGKNIVLRRTDPLDQGVVADTIIDGNQAGYVVTFAGTENDTCILSGFTIGNGAAELMGRAHTRRSQTTCSPKTRPTTAAGLQITNVVEKGRRDRPLAVLRQDSDAEKLRGSWPRERKTRLQKVSGGFERRPDGCPRMEVLAEVGLIPSPWDRCPSQRNPRLR